MKVYLAVGHGRQPSGVVDPGATSADGSATEQNQGAPIVASAAAALSRVPGVQVRAQGEGDPNFVGYTAEAIEWGADVLVSVHHDWRGAPRGAFGFWHSSAAHSKRLADRLFAQVKAAGLPMRPRHHTARDGLYVLSRPARKRPRMASVLWECDRIGEVEDLAGYGELLAAGIVEHGRREGLLPKDTEVPPPAEPEDSPKPAPKPVASIGWTEALVKNLPTLRRRDDLSRANANERRLQGLLAAAGVLPIGPNVDRAGRFDGKFGPSTERAVRAFQTRRSITVDGIVGRQTWTNLLGGR